MIIAFALAILTIIFATYGEMIRRIRSGVTFYRVWFFLASASGILLLAYATGAFQSTIMMLSFPAKAIIAGMLIICMLCLIASQALIVSKFNAKGAPELDIIIVLGAQVRPSGPSSALKSRLDSAVEYMEANLSTQAIVSGGQGWNEPMSEAQCMASYLVDHGIAQHRIILEDQSTSTVENLLFSSCFCDPKTECIGIVTNNFHVLRSIGIAKKLGYQNVTGIAAYSDPKYLPNNMLRESLGIAKDLVAGNMTLFI